MQIRGSNLEDAGNGCHGCHIGATNDTSSFALHGRHDEDDGMADDMMDDGMADMADDMMDDGMADMADDMMDDGTADMADDMMDDGTADMGDGDANGAGTVMAMVLVMPNSHIS